MKRNSALIRKLKALSEESRQSILDDIAKTNQSKVGRWGGGGGGGGDSGWGWAGLADSLKLDVSVCLQPQYPLRCPTPARTLLLTLPDLAPTPAPACRSM